MVNLPTPFDASTVAPVIPHSAPTVAPASQADHFAATRYRFVPADMRAAPCWMVARDKKPHRVTRGEGGAVIVSAYQVDHHDAANHCTFADAMQAIAADPIHELGFVLGVGNDFVCVDLDDLEKVTPEHQQGARDWQTAIRERLTPLTYSEVSRSGKGWHFIGRCPTPPTDKASVKHPEYRIDLLLRSFLVVTGDHQPDAPNATTEIANITPDMAGLFRKISEGDGPATAVATLPADGVITPGRVTDAKQLRLILSAGRNGEAFRDGRKTHSWSDTYRAILNAAAQFCTDEQLVFRVISTSGLVQLAEDKGSESRLEKMQRRWADEWPSALIQTEPSRRADAAAHVEICTLTLADLWEQGSLYVQYMVQERAKQMITAGLISGASAGDLAPLFHYLKPETLNQLEDDLRRTKNDAFARVCMEARVLAHSDTDTSVAELDAYMNKVAAQEREIDRKARFQQYNQQYYIIENYGGAARVFRDEFHPDTGAQVSWSVRAFCEAKAHDKVLDGWDLDDKRPVLKSAANMWVISDSARRYVRQEARFETSDREITVETGRVLNLFQGWATAPVAGEWPAIRYLVHDILCSGANEASTYLLNYLAQMVQQPHVLPGTAVILQSEEQGTGKSTFMALLRRLLGARYCSVTSDAGTLVGQFNAQAMNKVLLHFEEAVAPNDRVVESKVKALITNETLTYNPKGLPAIEARNYARVFMTSNAQQVAHLARHDRRMFVLSVSPKHANDAAFWSQAHQRFPQEMEAFMHALRTRDISGFRPAQMPHTSAKDRQKLESVVGPDRILRDFLEAGRLPACSHFDGRTWEVRVSALTEQFIKNGCKVGHSFPQPARVFAPVAMSPVRVRRINVTGQASKTWRVISLPTLADARAAFLMHQNVSAYDWGDDMADWALD